MINVITDLSHEFGTEDYVCGGGGNTSCKDEKTLWVKPSGTTLLELQPEKFVAMDREKLSQLYDIEAPDDSSQREELVKTMMEKAVLPTSSGRASVEAPLHNCLQARYVVHTHPALVNGMTCAKKGQEVAGQIFPDALWIEFIDPGYTLCMRVRDEIINFRQRTGKDPEVIFLQNHGVFISADTPERLRELYSEIFDKLKGRYKSKGISLDLEILPEPSEEIVSQAKEKLFDVLELKDQYVEISGSFDIANGPISPDHIVYSKSYPLMEYPTKEKVDEYVEKFGYYPQVLAFDDMVFGTGKTENKAKLALKMAQDGALVKKLAEAFGGVEYMTEQARKFIENWEVESYRSKQV